MSDLLSIGASGLSSYRTALSTVSDNVVNANTKGYVRRDVQLSTVSAGGVDPFRSGSGASLGGVRVDGIVRGGDAFKVADSRLTAADAARADARARWLALAEGQLPGGATGVAAKVTAAYAAADGLAADPDGALPRQAMLAAIGDAAGALRTGAEGLARVSAGVATEAGDAVSALNAHLAALDKVNTSLRRLPDGSAGKAAALDERDRLIDGIAQTIGIEARFDASGAATLNAAGDGGAVLIDARGPAGVDLAAAEDGRLSLALVRDGTAAALSPSGGSLAGLVDSAAHIAGRRRQLDGIAADFAAELNAWNAAGQTADGAAGTPLLAGTSAATLALATDDPGALAAANGTAANGNALALAARRGAGGIESRTQALAAALSQSVAAAKAESSAAAPRADAAALARDEGSGVDLDREAAELIRFQQAYDGSAKIVQIARETLQTLLQIL